MVSFRRAEHELIGKADCFRSFISFPFAVSEGWHTQNPISMHWTQDAQKKIAGVQAYYCVEVVLAVHKRHILLLTVALQVLDPEVFYPFYKFLRFNDESNSSMYVAAAKLRNLTRVTVLHINPRRSKPQFGRFVLTVYSVFQRLQEREAQAKRWAGSYTLWLGQVSTVIMQPASHFFFVSCSAIRQNVWPA